MSVKGADDLIRRLEAMGETNAILRVAQLDTVAEAKRTVHRRTAHLSRSIVPGRVTKKTATVEARTPYAAAEELGRRAVTIRPVNARVLAWGGETRLSGRQRSGSRPTNFAMEVHQPARPGHPYLIPAAKKAIGRFKDLIVKAWNEAA